jgi:hypothetical protein
VGIETAPFFFPVFWLDKTGAKKKHLGSAFPVTPGGGLLTCQHVVDVKRLPAGESLAVLDTSTGKLIPLPAPVFPKDPSLDLALLPGVMKGKQEYLPILEPKEIIPGLNAMTWGFFALGGRAEDVEDGLFSGGLVNVKKIPGDPRGANHESLVLPYAVVEGMSGSAVLMEHHGMKLAGICYGNAEQRIQKEEETIVSKNGSTSTHSVSRVVYFGLAYSAAVIIAFLESLGVKEHRVGRLFIHDIPGIEGYNGVLRPIIPP